MRGHHRCTQITVVKSCQRNIIGTPGRASISLDLFDLLELAKKKGGDKFSRQERRAQINPSVFVHLTPEKPLAIGSLLSNNFGAFNETWILDRKGAALSRNNVLGLMETK